MRRDYRIYLNDILESIRRIEKYTKNLTFEEFKENELIQDAVLRNLEVIGEAVKKIPDEIKNRKPEIEWRKIAGFRDVLIHSYFKVDVEIVWDVIKNKIPSLKRNVKEIISEIRNQDEGYGSTGYNSFE